MTLYMPFFKSCTTFRTLTQLHAHLFVTGLHQDPLASTKLIESYAQMDDLKSAKLAFDSFPKPDSFMWGVLMKCIVWNGLFDEAISLYNYMLYNKTQISSFIFPSILRACSGYGDIGIGGKVHGRVIKCGFDSDAVVETSLLSMYAEMGGLDNARKVFDEMPIRDVVSWSSIVSSYVQNGRANEGLKVFRWMVAEGVNPDSVTMLCVAEACGELGFLRLAKSIHGYILRQDIGSDGSLGNSLIVMYSKCGDLCSSEKMFKNISQRNIASWTAMISSYNQNGSFREALAIFVEMLESNAEPNAVTLMSVLCSCAGLGWLNEGKSVHCNVIRKAVHSDFEFLRPTLIDFYASCGKITYCEKVFGLMGGKSMASWNMLISAYARRGLSNKALTLFVQMKEKGLYPDSYTLASVLSICADIGLSWLGCQIHGHVLKTGFSDEFVNNSLMDMYSKCGFVYAAYEIFDKIQIKSVVTWNNMICGFSQTGNSIEAIILFDQMYLNRLRMDNVTFLSVIQACSNIGYLEKGKWVHHKLITFCVEKDIYINTALTDMYAKCGYLLTAQQVFDSMVERNIVSWSVMIAGYGMHGKIDTALVLFTRMIESGIEPNEVTFMNILSACAHTGCVEEGKYYFNLMSSFSIEPNSEHFACMIDLLSRAGDLDGAYRIIKSMRHHVDASLWGALLNGCRIHHRMDMIKSIERNLLDMDTDDTGYFTLLSNIYAEGGNWDEFGKVRSKVRSIGLRKVPGYSSVEIGKTIYRFGAGDMSNSQMKETYKILEDLQRFTQEIPYDVETTGSRIDSSEIPNENICSVWQEAKNCTSNSSNDTNFSRPMDL